MKKINLMFLINPVLKKKFAEICKREQVTMTEKLTDFIKREVWKNEEHNKNS